MWLSVPQLAGFLNITPQAVRKAIAEGRYTTARYEDSSKRGGSSGKVCEVSALDPAVPGTVRQALGLSGEIEKLKTTILQEAQR